MSDIKISACDDSACIFQVNDAALDPRPFYVLSADYSALKEDFDDALGREAALREDLASELKELAMWKSNHASMVERAKLLRDRPDMPVERIAAFERMSALQQRLTVAEQRETELIGLLKLSLLAVDDVAENCEDQADWATANSMHALSKRITAALKPAEGEG